MKKKFDSSINFEIIFPHISIIETAKSRLASLQTKLKRNYYLCDNIIEKRPYANPKARFRYPPSNPNPPVSN